jgi:hypothetical protein
MNNILLALAVCGLAAACRSTSSAVDEGIPFRTIARGYQSGLDGDELQIARNEDEWRAMWKHHTSNVLPRPEPPEVDFDRDMVVCVLTGYKPTTGYGITVVRVIPKGDGLYVEAVGTTPEFGAILPQVVSHPFHMIAVPRRDGVVTTRTETHGPDTE